MHHQNLQPVAIQERIQTIDIIRGFALLGILIVNMTVDNPGMRPMQGRNGFLDQLVYWPIEFFLNDKFMNIFCFLFGLGFAIQLTRAKENNSNFIFFYIRRLMVLFLFGAFIKIFITGRGVLTEYAMAGLLLLLLYKLPRKLLPVLAFLCIAYFWTKDTIWRQQQFPSAKNKITIDTTKLNSYAGVYEFAPGQVQIFIRKGERLTGEGPVFHYRLIPLSDSEFRRVDANVRISFLKDLVGNVNSISYNNDGRKNKLKKIKMDLQLALKEQLEKRKALKFETEKLSYKQFVTRNAKRFWGWVKNLTWKSFLLEFLSRILPVLLLGVYAGRRKVFSDISSNRTFFQRTMKWCLPIGMVSISLPLVFDAYNYFVSNPYEVYYRFMLWYRLCWDIGSIIMALGIVAWLTLLLEKPDLKEIGWKKRFSFFIPVGRMGLTNYILLLVIADLFIMGDYGFGLAGKIGPFLRLMIALPVFALIAFISRWWLKHFKNGPFEWLWRSLTYLKFQPIRLKEADKSEIKETGNI